MQQKIYDYMMKLNTDSSLLAKHNANPELAAREFGLPDADVALLASGDDNAIKDRFSGPESADSTLLVAFHSPR